MSDKIFEKERFESKVALVESRKHNRKVEVLDLFCGMGGLAYGFAKTGFTVVGVDISREAGLTFSFNRIGDFILADLTKYKIGGKYDIILGGPPCEPWSCLNLRRRRSDHPKYGCIIKFFEEVRRHMPKIFILENVPPIRNDSMFIRNLENMRKYYNISQEIVRYSDYGAAFARHRYIAVGVIQSTGIEASSLMDSMDRKKASTVKEVISDLRDKEQDTNIDHIWPNIKTIHKYRDYYKTGKYGWYILSWDMPSPSFGNVTKTYILHPDSFNNGKDARAISVREALRIVGFPDDYMFPPKIGLRMKYGMIAASVSPVFSLKLAEAVKNIVYSL